MRIVVKDVWCQHLCVYSLVGPQQVGIHWLLPLRLKVLLWTLRLKVETWDRYWTGLFTASAEAPHCWGCPRTFSDESSP